MNMIERIANELSLRPASVVAVSELIAQDCTVPFIARYRKEKTGDLDEVQVLAIRDLWEHYEELEKRRKTILETLESNGHLTPDLKNRLLTVSSLVELEDLYLPYRPKRRTKATIALEKGLEGLADLILQNKTPTQKEIELYVLNEKGVHSSEEALAGAQDIVAEKVSDRADARNALRDLIQREGVLTLKKPRGAEESSLLSESKQPEKLFSVPSHRLLSIMRFADEGQIAYSVEVSPEKASALLEKVVTGFTKTVPLLSAALQDSWKRLLQPSLENEAIKKAKELADQQAIHVFAENLRELLLSPPLGQKRVLAVDPGLRTGCKIVVLSAQGNLIERHVIFPLEPHRKTEDARNLVLAIVKKFAIEAVAIGNGTGGRESFDFFRSLELKIPVVSVSESGASVYSASEIAREEFPQEDLTVRGAVSIGRRLIDPLAELVKIDPKSIGVGQYQHDVDQKALKKKLDDVVVSCVNNVGVDVNTATKHIMTYVSGLNERLANSIVAFRGENGPFSSRKELLKVKGMGEKSFEQSAGFLRIRNGKNPLDASAVHPESYPVVELLARQLQCTVGDLIGAVDLEKKAEPFRAVLNVAEVTFKDILKELKKPGLDPRAEFEDVQFDPAIRTMDDLKEGQILNGVITNVTAFGAFVDVGVHQDGLVHISQLSDQFVRNPMDVVKVGQKVRVKVVSVEKERKRIALSRKGLKT